MATAATTTTKTVLRKGKAPVDAACPLIARAHVYHEGDVVYDVMMSKTDIAYSVKGSNKFYVLQLLQSDTTSSEFYLWQRWGRVGDDGTSLLQGPFTVDVAKAAFGAKFQSKTGNQFASGKPFVLKPSKYDVVALDYEATTPAPAPPGTPSTAAMAPAKPASVPDSRLDPRLRSLIELISNVSTMESEVLQMHYDVKKAPLGKLSKSQIKAGYEALKEIETILNQGRGPTCDADLLAASNRFYTKIPHDFGRQRPPLIESLDEVRLKVSLLETLGEIEIAMGILQKPPTAIEHPLDSFYHKLQCAITPLEAGTPEYQLIQRYLSNTHGHTHVSYRLSLANAFAVDRVGETARYRYDLPNQQLLWHGSRTTNYSGILSQGLRIAPPEAPATGYMFGKGVYTADMVSKSANYCSGWGGWKSVAVGDPQELLAGNSRADRLPPGKHSTKGIGRVRPDPAEFVTTADGVHVPLGRPVFVKGNDAHSQATLEYNEYIVYSVTQIRMRYLLHVHFV